MVCDVWFACDRKKKLWLPGHTGRAAVVISCYLALAALQPAHTVHAFPDCGLAIGWLVADVGEAGADLVGFWGSDCGVTGEGFLPVVHRLEPVAVGLIGGGEAGVGAGLLPWRVGLQNRSPTLRDIARPLLEVRAGLVITAEPQVHITELD